MEATAALAIDGISWRVMALLLAVAVGFLGSRWVGRALDRLLKTSQVPSASIFVNLAKALVWALTIMAVSQPVFGVEPTAFLAALGVTSLALSLGLQDTISNLVGGVSLMAGRVVKPGDLVRVGDFTGVVVDVTWRSTTVRNRLGDEQIIPNSVLNKTALTHLTTADEALAPVEFVVAHGADLLQVERDIKAAQAAMGDMLRDDMPSQVYFRGTDAYGVQCLVALRLAPGVIPNDGKDALMRGIAGKEWFSDVVGQ